MNNALKNLYRRKSFLAFLYAILPAESYYIKPTLSPTINGDFTAEIVFKTPSRFDWINYRSSRSGTQLLVNITPYVFRINFNGFYSAGLYCEMEIIDFCLKYKKNITFYWPRPPLFWCRPEIKIKTETPTQAP